MGMYRFGIGDLLLLLAVLASAALPRVCYLRACAEQGSGNGLIQVQEEWSGEQERLFQDFQQGTSSKPAAGPLYPWLLAMLAKSRSEPAALDRLVRWLQCGLGTLTAGLYFLFGCQAFRSRWAGTVAGLLCAVHPFWIAAVAERGDGVLSAFILGLCLVLGARASLSAEALTSWLLGLGLAALALTRPILFPFAFLGLLWFLLGSRSLQRGWLGSLLAVLGFLGALLPWTLRTYRDHHDIYPIVDSAYVHLWMGNSPQATGGPIAADQAATSRRELARTVWQESRDNPAGTLQRRLWAGLCFYFGEDWLTQRRLWHGDLSAGSDTPAWPARAVPWFGALFYASLLGMFLLATLGWRWTNGAGKPGVLAALAFVWIPLPYLLCHAEALSGPRLPLDGVLLCYAAYAVVHLCRLAMGQWEPFAEPG